MLTQQHQLRPFSFLLTEGVLWTTGLVTGGPAARARAAVTPAAAPLPAAVRFVSAPARPAPAANPAQLATAVPGGAATADGGGAPGGTAGSSPAGGGASSLMDGGTAFSLPDGTYFGDGSAVGQPPPPPARPLQDVSLHSMAGAPVTLSAEQSSWPQLIGLQAQVCRKP